MFDPYDNTWTDKTGRSCPVQELEYTHLLNIQKMLQRQIRNPAGLMARASNLAAVYGAQYGDRDWYSEPEDIDLRDVLGEVRIALMKISQEVNRRRPSEA